MAFSLGSIFKQGRVSPPRAAKPFFNGMNPSSDFTITGGACSTVDKDGILRPSYINYPAIKGGRWATTVAEGALLGPELAPQPLDLQPSSWIAYDATKLSATSYKITATDGRLVRALTTAGKRYLITAEASGPFRLRNSNTSGDLLVGSGSVEIVAVGAYETQLSATELNTVVTVNSLSVREVIPQWLSTDIYGNDLQPSKVIRTAKGLLKEHVLYDTLDHESDSDYSIGDKVLIQTTEGPMWMECIGVSEAGDLEEEGSEYFTAFNGFEDTDYTYTGGPVVTEDNTGALVTSPAGVLPITGMRNTENGWVDYTLDMASIYTTDSDFIGVMYDTATDTWERVGASRGEAVGQLPPGFMSHQIFNKLRRVVLADDGTVYKGISWADFTKHDDGTDVDLTGGNGQIMMEYLPAYYLSVVDGTKYGILLSEQALPGFHLHPVFQDSSAVYLGAYEASLVPGQTKLSSIALDPRDGTSPVWPVTTRSGDWGHTNLTTEATDTLAEARGAGWQQYDYLTLHWQWMLGLVGFAGWNFQAMVGYGRSSLSGGAWENDSYIGRCGLGDAKAGMYSAVQVGGSGGYLTDYSTLMGIENLWGNVWKRNVALFSNNAVYYKPEPPYDYTTVVGWTRLLDAAGAGVTLPAVSGYGRVPFSGLGFGLPVDVTVTSSTRLTDYFYADTGGLSLRVPLVGGAADSGTAAGPFCVSANIAVASTIAYVGGRLVYKGGA